MVVKTCITDPSTWQIHQTLWITFSSLVPL